MRKIFVLATFLLPLGVIAEDVVTFDGITEPMWKDFAPSAFVNIQEPRGLGKLNETASYWYSRKVDFDNAIQECKTYEESDMRFTCFQEVKVKQYQKNSDYNARIEAQERAKLVPYEMYDKTNTMLPLGGHINNFTRFQPNEFR